MKKQVLVMALAAAGFVVGCKEEPKKTPPANTPTPPAAGHNGSDATNPSTPATMHSGHSGLPTTEPMMPPIPPATRPAIISPSTRPTGSSSAVHLPIGTSPSTQPVELNK